MTVKGFVDYNNLKEYDEQIKKYIDKKLAEAIEAYRVEDKADDSIFDDQTGDNEKI